MTDKHPITPPATLVAEWASESLATQSLCTKAARWGADQELEACKRIAYDRGQPDTAAALQRIRRPKPPSQKEQALEALDRIDGYAVSQLKAYAVHDDLVEDVNLLRQILDGLSDD